MRSRRTWVGCAVVVAVVVVLVFTGMSLARGEEQGHNAPCVAQDATRDVSTPEVTSGPTRDETGAARVHEMRHRKCDYLWATVAPWSHGKALAAYFVDEHERQGIGGEWFASMVYGYANFGLSLRRQAQGLCYGPMDVKWPGYARQAGARKAEDLLDPWLNIRAHTLEAKQGVAKGKEGLELCKWIMYPAAPMDWGGGRFAKTWARFETVMARGFAAGKIGD